MSVGIQRIDAKPAEVNEEGTLLISGTFQDENGDAIPKANFDECTLTLYDQVNDSIINSRDGVSILDSIGTDGVLALTLLPADNALVAEGNAGTKERHIALIRWRYNSTRRESQEIEIDVVRIHRIGEE